MRNGAGIASFQPMGEWKNRYPGMKFSIERIDTYVSLSHSIIKNKKLQHQVLQGELS